MYQKAIFVIKAEKEQVTEHMANMFVVSNNGKYQLSN